MTSSEHAADVLRYDVVIVGAGPAGAATAIALRQRGLSVALLERGASDDDQGAAAGVAPQPPWPSIGEAVSPMAQYPLRELGLWEDFQRLGYRASHLSQSVWGDDELRERHAIEHKLGPDYHVDRPHFDAWLRRRAIAGGADSFAALAPERAAWAADRGRFCLTCREASRAFEARFLVDATGRAAWLTRQLGGRRQRHDDLVCVGRWYERASFEPSILVEATSSGWWYSGPLPQGRALALHLTCADSVAGARQASGWQQVLKQARLTAQRLDSATPVGPVRVCSATPTLAIWDPQLPFLPVGDAAVAFDPISGSGLCFAFRSALEAASVLVAARTGRTAPFAGYQRGLGNVFEEHVQRRALLYAHERRWPQAPFWRRRHTAAEMAALPKV